MDSSPADLTAHNALVAQGFAGSVLKRPGSDYRPGAQPAWIAVGARRHLTGSLRGFHREPGGTLSAVCALAGEVVRVEASLELADQIGRDIRVRYARRDADGSLRRAHIDALL